MANNHMQVSQGFRILLGALAPYIARELRTEFGDDWWKAAVIDTLYDDQKRDLPLSGEWAMLVDSLISPDASFCLIYIGREFSVRIINRPQNMAKELVGVRNKLAHLGGEDFTADDTWRALDTMSRLCEQIDPEGAEEIRVLLRTSRYGSANGSTTVTEGVTVLTLQLK